MFVFHNVEAPINRAFRHPAFRYEPWRSAFNWTMTYRFDSNIVSLFGILRKKPLFSYTSKNYTEIVANKTGLVAWITNECKPSSLSHKYMNALKKHIPVEVYGKCGIHTDCNRADGVHCAEMVSKKYKFYLSFENAICQDYISEKFFRYISLDVIPVTRGFNNYFQHSPSEIFINTADFGSPELLAKRLLYLDKHDDVYIKMLREKDKYMSVYDDYIVKNNEEGVEKLYHHYDHESVAFCELCQKLWNFGSSQFTISDIGKWFKDMVCQDPTDIDNEGLDLF